MREYFPDYGLDEDGYLPQRDYFWNVYNSIDSEDCMFKVQTLMRMQESKSKNEDESVISIRADIFEVLRNSIPS